MEPRPRASAPAQSPRQGPTYPAGAATQPPQTNPYNQGQYSQAQASPAQPLQEQYDQGQYTQTQYPQAQYPQAQYAPTQPPQPQRPPAASGYAQPATAQPLTQDPWAIASAYGQPGYDQPGYDQPGYDQPGYGPLPTRPAPGPDQQGPVQGQDQSQGPGQNSPGPQPPPSPPQTPSPNLSVQPGHPPGTSDYHPSSTISVAQARRLAQLHSQTQQTQGGYGPRTYRSVDSSAGHLAGQQPQGHPGAIAPSPGPRPTRDPFAPAIARGYTSLTSENHRASQTGTTVRQASTAVQRSARKPRYLEEDDDFVPQFQPRGRGEAGGSAAGNRPGITLPSFQWQNLPLGEAKFWSVIGSVVFAAVMLNILATSPVISSIVKERNRQCQEVVQPSSVLSRDQLTRLLTVPERSPKADIRNIISEPYCRMPGIKIRAGVNAVREAYPLEFDPETWIVVLYEGDEYAGYRFNAR